MSAPRSFEHAHLRVTELGAALDFYVGLMGLAEVGREDGVVYLGVRPDEGYDVAISEGGTGLEHFAIRIDDGDELARHERALGAAGVAVERRDGGEPGQQAGIRFALPSGTSMEFVLAAGRRSREPQRAPVADGGGSARTMRLLGADHIGIVATDVSRDAQFLCDVLGFRCSDRIVREDGRAFAAWARYGGHHHDVAVFAAANAGAATLQHVAWTCASLEHLASCCDLLAEHGIALELGVGRHPIGGNYFAYFHDPGGNRTEFTANMAVLDEAEQERVWTDQSQTLNAWSQAPPPPSFGMGT